VSELGLEKEHICINNDRAIKQLVENFDELNNPNTDQNHLRAIQYLLMKNDFENWNDYTYLICV